MENILMLLKKVLLTGLAVATISLPALALADLDTYNYTDEDSSVRIVSNGICATTFGQYTPKRVNAQTPSSSHTTNFQINVICGKASGNCDANIYASKDCSGDIISKATLNLDSQSVSATNLSATYNVIASGSKVEIRYTDGH